MNTTTVRRVLNRAAAAVTAVILFGFAGVSGAAAQDRGENDEALGQFAACVAGEGSADLLLVMDESASLSEEEFGATDTGDLRVSAAKDFVSEMGRTAEETGAEIRVRTAGFGTDYYDSPDGRSGNAKNPDNYDGDIPRDLQAYGDWSSLTGGVDDAHAELDKFADRTDDMHTEYPDALRGMVSSFADSDTPCRAVMMFSDGEMTVASGDTDAAVEEMCRPGGVVSQVRGAGIQLFTVGLNAEGAQDMTLLRDIAEGSCGAPPEPNGQFFEGSDAAGLLAAFRSALPNPGGASRTGLDADETFAFTLDNSISPVTLEAQPEQELGEGEELIPLLIPPGGKPFELTEAGAHTVGDAEVDVTHHDWAPGAVDIEMSNTGDWAGEWQLGYRAVNTDASYRASLTIKPGMQVEVTDPAGTSTGVLTAVNNQPLEVTLVDRDGQPVKLDGEAVLDVIFQPFGGEEVTLLDGADVSSGQPVQVPLDAVTEMSVGTVTASVRITTAPAGSTPGTELSPVMSQHGLSVSLENMPKPPSVIDLGSVTEENITVEAPVTGPGRVWIEPGPLAEATLPDGTGVTVSSSADSVDDAVNLERDESGVLPLDIAIDELADGPLNGEVTVHFSEADGSNPSQINVPVRGAMSVPVDQAAFAAAFILALVIAVAIPLAVLYLMKYLSGRIPVRPGIFAQRIPVRVDGARVVHPHNGEPFNTVHEDFLMRRVAMDPRQINVEGIPLRVKYGFSPLSAAYVVAGDQLSISGRGRQQGTSAKLPLVVQNSWFITMDPTNADDVSIIMMIDDRAHTAKVEELNGDVRRRAPELIAELARQRKEMAGNTRGGSSGRSAAAPSSAPTAPPAAPQPGERPGPFGGGGPAPGPSGPFGGGTGPSRGPGAHGQPPTGPRGPFG